MGINTDTTAANPVARSSNPLAMGPKTSDKLLAKYKNDPFVLQHNHLNWYVHEGEWLPLLRVLTVVPGLLGVDKHYNTDLMIARMTREGYTVLNPGNPKVGNYLRETPCFNGVHHHVAWETPETIAGKPMPANVDREARRAFERKLLSDGVLLPPTDAAKRLIMARLGKRYQRSLKRTDMAMSQRNDEAAELLDDAKSARDPNTKAPKASGLLSGSAYKDRAACKASDDTKALWVVVRGGSEHVTVRRAALKRLGLLGESTLGVEV